MPTDKTPMPARAAASREPTVTSPPTAPRCLKIAKAWIATGEIPSDEPHWTTQFQYGMGPVDASVRAHFSLGEFCAWPDVGRKIEAALAAKPKPRVTQLDGWNMGGR